MRELISWQKVLNHDPKVFLLSSLDPAVNFFANKIFQFSKEDPKEILWNLPAAIKIIEKQDNDGSRRYRGNRPGDAYGEKYELLETWRALRILVEKFGYDQRHFAIKRAVDQIFTYQTDEGDIRGILSNQYTPYYMGAMLETIIHAGYIQDDRVLKGFDWLESMQQIGGGWIIPMSMYKMSDYYGLCQNDPIPPNRNLLFSHTATGMVMRAYAAHPRFRHSDTAWKTGDIIKKRFFRKDTFTSRQAPSYWTKFQYPFWWTDLVSVMDSLQKIGFQANDEDIQKAIRWFIINQNENGSWNASYGGKNDHADEWVTLAVCRILMGFFEGE